MAVLAVFGQVPVRIVTVTTFLQVGVNPDLYNLVFGESLLNDGVAVVFYEMMMVFVGLENAGIPVTVEQVLMDAKNGAKDTCLRFSWAWPLSLPW